MRIREVGIIASFAVLLVLFNAGCHYSSTITKNRLRNIDSSYNVDKVVTVDGRTILFGEEKGTMAHLVDSTLIGVDTSGTQKTIPISDIQNMRVTQFSVQLTILLPVAIAGAAFGVYALFWLIAYHPN